MEELREDFLQLCGMVCAVCFIVFLKSCVSCPSRRWPRLCNKTPPWRAWIWRITTSALKGRRLGVWWGWGHEGKRSEETAKDTADWKWHSGNDKRQCNAALISRCIHPVEICLWQVIGVGMCWPWSWLKRETIHSNSISKTGHPVIFEILGRAIRFGLEWHPNHMDVLEAEMVYVAGDSPNCAGRSFRW